MTCKDCIHYDVCEEKYAVYIGLPFSIANDKPCNHFKDKSRFIELPKADTERHAHWIDNGDTYECSNCGDKFYGIDTKFCSSCGCKMDEVVGNE